MRQPAKARKSVGKPSSKGAKAKPSLKVTKVAAAKTGMNAGISGGTDQCC